MGLEDNKLEQSPHELNWFSLFTMKSRHKITQYSRLTSMII